MSSFQSPADNQQLVMMMVVYIHKFIVEATKLNEAEKSKFNSHIVQ